MLLCARRWKAIGGLKKSLKGYQARLSAVKAQMMSRDNYLSARASSLTASLGRSKVAPSFMPPSSPTPSFSSCFCSSFPAYSLRRPSSVLSTSAQACWR